MRFTFDLTIDYPRELKDPMLKKDKLYDALRDLASIHCHQLAKTICEELTARFPSLTDVIYSPSIRAGIDEIVKNIFDAVNNAKVENINLESIKVKIVAIDKNNMFQIRIKDNGTGFEGVKAETAIHLDSFLSKKSQMLFPSSVTDDRHYSSSKQIDKQTKNKKYLLGGHGIGLSNMLKDTKSLKDIFVKNRKSGGADIRLVLSHAPCEKEPLDVKSKIPPIYRKASNDDSIQPTSETSENTELEDWLNENENIDKKQESRKNR